MQNQNTTKQLYKDWQRLPFRMQLYFFWKIAVVPAVHQYHGFVFLATCLMSLVVFAIENDPNFDKYFILITSLVCACFAINKGI